MKIIVEEDGKSLYGTVDKEQVYDVLELFCELVIEQGIPEEEVCDTIIEMANRIKENRYNQ